MKRRVIACLMVLIMMASLFVPQFNAKAEEIVGETNSETYGLFTFTIEEYDIGNRETHMNISLSNEEYTLAYLVSNDYSYSSTDPVHVDALKIDTHTVDVDVEGTTFVYVWAINATGESVPKSARAAARMSE